MQVMQQLTYRLFTEADLPGIFSLWENYSGWGSITEQQFNDWYVNTPYGSCPVVIAENGSGELVGQLSFIPTPILIGGKEVKGLRLSAPILHKDFRLHDLRSADHPAFLMIKHGMDIARELGYSILYSLPAYGWFGLLKMLPRFGLPDIKTASYDCVSISLTDNKTFEDYMPGDFDITVIDKFDNSFDELWKESSISFPINCGIVRNSRLLNWKVSNHLVFKIKKGESLIGYAAYKKKDGLLVDIFARTPEALKDVLLSSVKTMHCSNEKKINTDFEEIKLMCNPQLAPIIKTIATTPVNFRFAFCCYPLTISANNKHLLPENWYVMPGD